MHQQEWLSGCCFVLSNNQTTCTSACAMLLSVLSIDRIDLCVGSLLRVFCFVRKATLAYDVPAPAEHQPCRKPVKFQNGSCCLHCLNECDFSWMALMCFRWSRRRGDAWWGYPTTHRHRPPRVKSSCSERSMNCVTPKLLQSLSSSWRRRFLGGGMQSSRERRCERSSLTSRSSSLTEG